MNPKAYLRKLNFDKGKDSFHRLVSRPQTKKRLRLFEEMALYFFPVFLLISLHTHLPRYFFYALAVTLPLGLLSAWRFRHDFRTRLIQILFLFSAAAFVLAIRNIYDIGFLRVFPDTSVYLDISKRGLASLDFWALGARPFVTPLIFKIFGRDLAAINDFYIIFYLLASAVFIFAATRYVRTPRQRFIVSYVLIFFFLNQHDLSLWTSCAMSELPSIVLVLLSLAAFGLAFASRQRLQASGLIRWAAAGAVILLSFFLAFSRDTDAYFLPFMIPFYLAVFPKAGQKLFVSLGLLSIFVLAVLSAERAERWQFSLGNVLYQRIIPRAELRRLFQREYRFPRDEVVMPCANLWFQDPCSGKKPIVSWINRYGWRAYRGFLLKHPRYVFGEWIKAWDFQQQNLWTLERRPEYYADESIRGKRLNDFLFNFPGTVSFPIALLVGVFGILLYRRNPLILYGLTYSAVVGLLAFHGDAQAVPRHAQQPMMALKLSLLLVLLHIYSLIIRNDHPPGDCASSSVQANDP